jgi:hypothetical protein
MTDLGQVTTPARSHPIEAGSVQGLFPSKAATLPPRAKYCGGSQIASRTMDRVGGLNKMKQPGRTSRKSRTRSRRTGIIAY